MTPLLLFMGGLNSGMAQTPTPPLKKASDAEVEIYRGLYKSGVIRSIRFDQEPDPVETAREEIYLEGALARRAAQTTLTQDRALRADIDYYQGVEILNDWLRRQVDVRDITTAAVEAYYAANRHRFVQPEVVVFHHLFLLVPPSEPKALEEKRQQAEKLARQAKRGADFERLAAEFSELKGAKQDKGKVGPVPAERLNPAIQAGLRGLQPGAVSGPVRTPYGWELLRLDERQATQTIPLESVRGEIVKALLLEKAQTVQAQAVEKLEGQVPAIVNEQLLAAGADPLTSDAVILTVGERRMIVGDMLKAIDATYAFTEIQDEKERIRAALPRIKLTEQVKEISRREGHLDKPPMNVLLRMIHDRLLGEQYYKRHRTSRVPTEADIRARYEAGKTTNFTTRPRGKGTLYTWRAAEADQGTTGVAATEQRTTGVAATEQRTTGVAAAEKRTTGGAAAEKRTTGVASSEQRTGTGMEQTFRLELLRRQVEEIAAQARAGRISRDELKKRADVTTELDWFVEGPSGYDFDTAFFGTEAGQFTSAFPAGGGMAIAWVEAKEPSKPLTWDAARERVRALLINEWSQGERKAMIEEILRQYAQQP